MDTIREQIIQEIIVRLSGLIPESDVLRCSNEYSDTPGISLWDITDTASQSKYGSTQVTLELVIEYVESLGVDNPSIIGNVLIGQIITAMIGTDPTFAGLATSLTYAGSTIDFPDTGGDVLAVRLAFNLEFEFNTGDPYTKP